MADPDISGRTLTRDENNALIDHAVHGRRRNLAALLRQLAATKSRHIHDLLFEAKDHNQCGIIHIAAETGRVALIAMVWNDLDLGPAAKLSVLDQPGPNKRTAASIAAETNQGGFLQELVSKGANMLIRNWSGRVPLHWVAERNAMASAMVLLSTGPQRSGLNVQDVGGTTPLHCAVSRGNIMMARYLIRCGADVELQTMAGATVIHIAVTKWDEDNDDPAYDTAMREFFMAMITAPGSGPNGRANLRLYDGNLKWPSLIAFDMGHLKARDLLLEHEQILDVNN
ncbi:ankyrin [Coniochaeta ligniaria NRRL 30616]|uniref:Ankyrin n=1 Tax=Coniochaeta ligniaria NRRL 30616 TaxID=1408157 RepID=A0A1J7JLK2_9PEZI|nr:ankyrin [Coniochaeta ligniaria NRRL 30616]